MDILEEEVKLRISQGDWYHVSRRQGSQLFHVTNLYKDYHLGIYSLILEKANSGSAQRMTAHSSYLGWSLETVA